jgi:hypothetical protein
MLGASQQINTSVAGSLLRVSTAAHPTVHAGQAVRVGARPGSARWYDAQSRLVA